VLVSKTPNGFIAAARALWGDGFTNVLDAGTNTISKMGGGTSAIVILGPDFEVLQRAGDIRKGAYFMQTPGNPPFNFVEFQGAIRQAGAKGLLGGLKIPDAVKPAIPVIKAAQLSNALNFLKGLPDAGEAGEFKKELAKRIEDLRLAKRKLFDDAEKDGKKWDAFKAGASYLRVFPQAQDAGDMRTKVSKLQYDNDVKKELTAQQMFGQAVAQLYGPQRNPALLKQAAEVFKQVSDQCKGTEYAEMAAGMR
jgi:hypothetical protein